MSDIIGMTMCDNCKGRFKVHKKHQDNIGKPARCPRLGTP
jgi:hypothetical protein